jgi:hypothetical protein
MFAKSIADVGWGSFLRDTSMGRESMKEGWTGGTNDGATEKSLEGTVRADYLH